MYGHLKVLKQSVINVPSVFLSREYVHGAIVSEGLHTTKAVLLYF